MSDFVSFDDDAGAQFVTDLERLHSTFEQTAQILDFEIELSKYLAPGGLALRRYLAEVELDISFVSSVVQGFGGGPVPMSISEIAEELGVSHSEAERMLLGSQIEELNDRIENWNGTDNDPIFDRLVSDRSKLVEQYIGTNDPATIAAVLKELQAGEPIGFALQRAGTELAEAAYADTINDLAARRDLSFENAEALFAELTQQTSDLIELGYSPADAQEAVLTAEGYGLDIEAIAELASDEGIGLLDAMGLQSRADHYAMTAPELIAYDGLSENFATFDNPQGGDADGLVSLGDLHYIVDHPTRFTAAEVAAAANLLANPGLLSRLDTGRDNNDVLNDGDRFGDTSFDDGKFSLADIENFEWKQGVNGLVGAFHDDIDVINGGSIDGHLSKADFETYLSQHRGSLTENEIRALEVVIDGEFYDKGWLERNKRSIAIASAVVAGAVIAISTGGLGSGISGALITMAVTGTAGAGTAGLTTLGINAASSESDWDDDLLANAGHGFMGGMAGGGLGLANTAWAAAPGSVGRFAVGAGVVSDGAAVVGMGGIDWAMDTIPGVDHQDLGVVHDISNGVSLVSGVTGLTATGVQATSTWYNRGMAEGMAQALPDSVVTKAETFIPQGVSVDDARTWLGTADGQQMFDAARASHIAGLGENFDVAALSRIELDALDDEVINRVASQISTGTAEPALLETSESLYKLAPVGEDVSGHSPFWVTSDELDNLLGSRRDVADAMGLPYTSHADEYQIWRIDPVGDAPVSVFASDIAPTTELHGFSQTQGGVQQVLVPDRNLYSDAVIEIDAAIVNRANGGTIAPVRETAAVVQSAFVTEGSTPSSAQGPPVVLGDFGAPNIEEN